MIGQEVAALVTTFNLEIAITGAILTKLDGDSRGGSALSVKEVQESQFKLVGPGERIEDLEPFYPDQMAGRILGMGDMKQEVAEDLQKKKIMSAKFDFNDFLKQTRVVQGWVPCLVFWNDSGMGKGYSCPNSRSRKELTNNGSHD
ncbi:unnamed protein product [Lactuca virosa]|uniref:SRP54-type proteins GTP-binding domain-containing protein n=1 Tax=Lactuca virosa TaxID=75947 RepID=A0AAU9LRZ3_9ASTR|nr:unnamed protein product [Lactuca virosa]